MAARKPKKKKDTSFTTWKLNLENTVNGDPQADGECLQIVRAYLDWMGSPDARPYRSLLDLQVATSLSENTIVKRRRLLVKLGYFVPDGHTGVGATRFKIVNARENIVLDHQTIARETLRRLEAEKKEKRRATGRKSTLSPSRDEGPVSPSQDEELKGICPLTTCGDSPSWHEGNNVYNSVEAISIEEEGHLKGSPLDAYGSYLKAHHGDEANEPLPIPKDQTEADDMMAAICLGVDVHPSVRSRMMSMLKLGVLTPNLASGMIGKKKEGVA